MSKPSYIGKRFEAALGLSPLSQGAITLLGAPKSVHRQNLPVRMDDGSLRLFSAWRIRYSDSLGPTKGGVRFHEDANEGDLTTLAFRILLKCAVNGLPHGGAAGGVAVDPKSLSRHEKERLARAYVSAFFREIGPDRDILSPDLGTDAQTMDWMSDEYNRLAGASVPGAINGKSLACGGIAGRPGATARGAWLVLQTVLESKNLSPAGMTFAVQGFGSAGGLLADLLVRSGLRCVAATDSSGGWHSPQGLDVACLLASKHKGAPLVSLAVEGGTRIGAAEVLEIPADIVIPAATGNQITLELADRLRCKWILELANAPISPGAEERIAALGIGVIPDVVANAGGITMSHFEWCQNRGGLPWSAEEAHSRLDPRMRATSLACVHKARERGTSLAVAAQLLALEKIGSALIN